MSRTSLLERSYIHQRRPVQRVQDDGGADRDVPLLQRFRLRR